MGTSATVAAPAVPTPKPGYKTSEFWMTIATLLCGGVQMLTGSHTGANLAATGILAGASAVYTASRSYVKGTTANAGS